MHSYSSFPGPKANGIGTADENCRAACKASNATYSHILAHRCGPLLFSLLPLSTYKSFTEFIMSAVVAAA